MLLEVCELSRWLGVSVFELWLHTVGLLLMTVLLTIKHELDLEWMSYWLVFCPLFAATAFDFYFILIAFIRMVFEERSLKFPAMRASVAAFGQLMIALFEVVLCYKLNDAESGYATVRSSFGVVFLPIWILMACLFVRACQL